MPVGPRTRFRAIALLVLGVATLACVAGIADRAMAGSMSQDCAGPACEDQIGCGGPAQPHVPSGSSVHPVALPAIPAPGPVMEATAASPVGPPAASPARRPVAPVALRAPPAV